MSYVYLDLFLFYDFYLEIWVVGTDSKEVVGEEDNIIETLLTLYIWNIIVHSQ